MKIYSARQKAPQPTLRELKKQRTAIVDEYNKKKAVFDEQFGKYNTDRVAYETAIIDEIKSLLANELKALPGVEFKIEPASSSPADRAYSISMFYNSTSSNTSKYINERGKIRESRGRNYVGYQRIGFNWMFKAYWYTNYWNNNAEEFIMKPIIDADILSSDDYDTMAATYDLFSKLNTIDWTELITRITKEIPKKEDYLTVENPGSAPRTYDIDKQISSSQLDSMVGEDMWIRADYYASGNQKYPNRDRYIKLVREGSTKAYCYGYIASSWWFNDGKEYLDRSCSRLQKIRRAGIKPKQPVEFYTTDELLEMFEKKS